MTAYIFRKSVACVVLGVAILPSSARAQAATPTPEAAATSSSARNSSIEQGNRPGSMDILPLVNLAPATRATTAHGPPNGAYVRFILVNDPSNNTIIRNYHDETRGGLSRFFRGRNLNRVVTARFSVTGSNTVSSTVTLASAIHHSNRREGESFTSELNEGQYVTDYIRIDSGSTVSINVRMLASHSTDADITQNILGVIGNATRLIAPESSLVTSLTSERVNDASRFVDGAISSLFAETIAETSTLEIGRADWHRAPAQSNTAATSDPHLALASITAYFPFNPRGGNSVDYQVGNWQVRVSPAIISIFSDHTIDRSGQGNSSEGDYLLQSARSAMEGVTPAQVLSFRIDGNLTLGEVIRGDAGVSAALLRFDPSNKADQAQTAIVNEICYRMSERAYALGLNRFDTAATVWAIASSGLINRALAASLWPTDRLADGSQPGQSSVCEAIELAKAMGLRSPSSDVIIVPHEEFQALQETQRTLGSNLTEQTRRIQQLEAQVQQLEQRAAIPPPPILPLPPPTAPIGEGSGS